MKEISNVKVYRNLHKKCFSVKVGNKVVAHLEKFILEDCEFRVSQKGRERVLREKQKNVHAYIKAKKLIVTDEDFNGSQVHYNPYFQENFSLELKRDIFKAKKVFLSIDSNKKIILLEE